MAEMSHWALLVFSMEANWVSVISSLLSYTGFFKRVHSSGGGEARSEPLGLMEGGGG